MRVRSAKVRIEDTEEEPSGELGGTKKRGGKPTLVSGAPLTPHPHCDPQR